MTLPYTRQPDALRPSMFRMFEEDPLRAYLVYLGPEGFAPPYEQSIPAAAGTVMHAYAESFLTGKPLSYEIQGLDKDQTQEAVGLGKLLWWQYLAAGGPGVLQAIGVEQAEYEIPEGMTVPGTDIPLGGRIDVLLRGNVVHDFKTSGTGQPGRGAPYKGYQLAVGCDKRRCDVEVNGAIQHKAFGIPMEEVNRAWADQFAMYSWGVGMGVQPVRVSVHQVVYGVGTFVFDAEVSVSHQRDLIERCKRVWGAIQDERVVPPAIAAGGVERVRECA